MCHLIASHRIGRQRRARPPECWPAGSARSGCPCAPPCSDSAAAACSFLATPVPLNSAMAYSTWASVLSAIAAAASSRAASASPWHAAALLVQGRERVLRFRIAGFARRCGTVRRRARNPAETAGLRDRAGRDRRRPAAWPSLAAAASSLAASSRLAGPARPPRCEHRQREHRLAVAAVGGEPVPFGGLLVVAARRRSRWHKARRAASSP